MHFRDEIVYLFFLQKDALRRESSKLCFLFDKQARAQAEEAAKEEAEARANEERRVQELINLRQQLEKLLEEETQAKRDEEIVRCVCV